jgi:thermolabile hemolysin
MWVLPNNNSWFQGRFSNGYTWVEDLAKKHNLPLYNWAIGGAAGDGQMYGIIPGLRQEVNSWVEYSKDAKNYNKSKTLFTVWIGGNDLINYNRTVNQIMADVQDSVEAIIANGGKNILVLNLPDISVAPVFKINSQLDKAKIAAQVLDYDTKLASYIETLKSKYHNQINIEVFNTAASFNQIINAPSQYGLTNTTDSCLNLNTDSSGNYLKAQKVRTNCSSPDSFMFWDNLHPTAKMHEILASEVDKFIHNKYSF